MQHLEGVEPSLLDVDPSEVAAHALKVARTTALGILGDRDAAADVAQEVAIVAVAKVAHLRDPGALDAWLRRIAVRRALGCRPGTVRSLLSRGRAAIRARPEARKELQRCR